MKRIAGIARRLVVAIALTAFIADGAPVHGQDVLGGLAVGLGLKALGDRVNEAIERAVGGGIILEIGAGGQVALLIQQAQTTFDHERDLTFAQLNGEQQQIVNSVVSVANSFIDKTYADAADLEGRAQAITQSLPFSRTTPQVVKYSPQFATQVRDHNTNDRIISIVVDGTFPDAARSGYTPQLVLENGKPLPSVGNTLLALQFDVKLSDLKHSDTAITTNRLELVVPQRAGSFLFHHRDEHRFKLPIAILPNGFGTITITTTTPTPTIVSKNVTSTAMSQESYDDDIKCKGEHADQAIHQWPPDQGWTVDPHSVTYTFTRPPQGTGGKGSDWWLEENCSTPLVACLCFSTEHHPRGTSGKIWFQLSFTETKPAIASETVPNMFTMAWGENRVVTLPQNATWKGKAALFDGTTNVEFAGAFTHKYFKVTQNGTTLSISTIP